MSYNSALTDNKDIVRLLTGDTDVNDELLTDGEINYLTGQGGTVWGMAAHAANAIAIKFSRYADEQVGPLSYRFGQRAEQFRVMAVGLKSKAALFVTPTAGGILISEKNTQIDNSDRVRPGVSRGQFEDVEAVHDDRYSDFGGDANT